MERKNAHEDRHPASTSLQSHRATPTISGNILAMAYINSCHVSPVIHQWFALLVLAVEDDPDDQGRSPFMSYKTIFKLTLNDVRRGQHESPLRQCCIHVASAMFAVLRDLHRHQMSHLQLNYIAWQRPN